MKRQPLLTVWVVMMLLLAFAGIAANFVGTGLNQAIINVAATIVFSLVELGILYLLMRPAWGEFK